MHGILVEIPWNSITASDGKLASGWNSIKFHGFPSISVEFHNIFYGIP
jgi:hypothetical protein